MGSVAKTKVGELEYNSRDGRIKRNIKDVVRCVWALMGKKNTYLNLNMGKRK